MFLAPGNGDFVPLCPCQYDRSESVALKLTGLISFYQTHSISITDYDRVYPKDIWW